MPQDRDQHDDGRDIDPAAEEPQRRRRLSRPASIDGAAEAEAQVVLGPQTTGAAARLAWVSGRMQPAAAQLAALGPAGVGKVLVTGEQKIVESDIGQQGCVSTRRVA
jgi:hypothetical protein